MACTELEIIGASDLCDWPGTCRAFLKGGRTEYRHEAIVGQRCWVVGWFDQVGYGKLLSSINKPYSNTKLTKWTWTNPSTT
jgi:hypothetical protein